MPNKFFGFHLIELLIVISIIAILTSISLPLYSQHIVHVRRLEAARILSKLAIAMEQYYIEHNTYQNATLASLHFSEFIVEKNYRLIIDVANDHDYLLSAKPQGNQAEKDALCATLTLAANGEKNVTGGGSLENCW